MKKSKALRIALFVIADLFIVAFSSVMPLVFRFGIFTISEKYLMLALKWLPVDMIIAVAVIAGLKLYTRVWAFASIDEMVDCLKASLLIEAIYIAYKMLLSINMPRSYYPFNWMILFLSLSASRVAVRMFRRIKTRLTRGKDVRNIMIIGAGSAADMIMRELKIADSKAVPVCVIDDNKAKIGKSLQGVPIVGTRDSIVDAAEKYDISEIIIAIPSATPAQMRDLITICQQTKAKVKRLPPIAATLETSLTQSIREVNYEDLLGRDAVVIADPRIEEFLHDKTVMVTGGGGSIGSELCRQIVANKPRKLVIVDIYENTTYELEMELRRYYPSADFEVRIASVRDYDRMEDLFREFRPEVVYHAAAHKHVPLMEDSPNEAIKNNCLGTLNVVRLADKYKVKRFVMISTDKAVNPTNVMGATKRICEMIVQTYNKRSETEFVAVRFGNVLGSNGSVIPLFLKQIEAGGPVTLTHREITRFFMTIPEAVSLVLQAGLMAKGGEIFVLDMGEPVKIYDLAKNLIKMKGYVPEKDIRIEIVGLRPGEKLYEELLMDEEGLQDTDNHLIHIGKPINIDETVFLDKLGRLIDKAEENTGEIREDIKDICPTYRPGR